MSTTRTTPNSSIQRVQATPTLPANLPAGARAFQEAVDGKLTPAIWGKILEAQIKKAENGDRGAAQFLIEYAGGVQSFRGATFVNEVHHHHYQAELSEDEAAPAPKPRGRGGDRRSTGSRHPGGDELGALPLAERKERARPLALRLIQELSPAVANSETDLTSDLAATPEDLADAIDWLRDQGVVILDKRVEYEGLKEPGWQLGPGQSPRIKKLLAAPTPTPTATTTTAPAPEADAANVADVAA